MRVLVAYDGTLQAKDALRYGIEQVRENGGEVMALHVFENSMFYGYDSHMRAEELAKKESERFVEEARKILNETASDVRFRIAVEEGDPEEEIVRYANDRCVDLLLCHPRYMAFLKRFKQEFSGRGRKVSDASMLDMGMAALSMQ